MRRPLLLLLVLPTTALAADDPPLPTGDEVVAGFAAADITPPVGYRMAGGYSEVLAAGVDDPLVAKAAYVRQGILEPMVLIVCDVCGLERGMAAGIRRRVAKETRVSADAVCLAATHTHGGPMHYDPVFVDLFGDPGRHNLGDYPARFADGCVKAAVDAKANAREVTISAGTGTARGLAFNRRYHMRDGTVRFNPGKKNPDIVGPAGPVDEEVPAIRFEAAGKPVGLLVSFPMHVAVHGGPRFSADYPGHLQAALRARLQAPGLVSVFGQGAAGDVNHVNTAAGDPDPTPRAIGERLADAVAGAAFEPVDPKLSSGHYPVRLPLRADRPADLPAARDRLVGGRAKATPFLDQVEAYRTLLVHKFHEAEARPGKPAPGRRRVEVQAFKFGASAAVVALPHEVFVALGAEIRRRSPFKHTLVVTVANDLDCYVPTRKAFAEGSYEVTNSPYQPGVGEDLVEAAVRLLKGFR